MPLNIIISITTITFVLATAIIALLTVWVYPLLLQKQIDARVERKGGLQSLDDIKAAIGHSPYSLVSMPNEAGKPEIWVYLCDVGPCDAFEIAEQTTAEGGDGGKAFEDAIAEFRMKADAMDMMHLSIEKEVLDAVSHMSGALDLIEAEIGFAAAQKIDFGLIN